MSIKKVVVIINRTKTHATKTEATLREILKKSGIEQEWVESLPPSSNLHKQMENRKNKTSCLIDRDVDLVIAIGGDGTVLQAAHRIGRRPIPILGINIGFLGFITSLEEKDFAKKIKTILQGEFNRSVRTTLDVCVRKASGKFTHYWALNDVLITRGGNPHLIGIKTQAGIEKMRPLNTYRCDGLIFSTPTGSTAYSLSAGGPIVSPDCDVTVITPICPHSLTNRSVVISSKERLQLNLEENSGTADVLADGMKIQTVHPSDEISIKTSEHTIHLAFLHKLNYYETLSNKLNWHGDGVSRPKYGHTK